MEVVNQRSALLSNYEVLTLLKELESDHLAKTRTALRIKKEEEAAGLPRSHAPQDEVLENLRTIEVEAIQYLTADYQPTTRQSDASIAQLTRSLAPHDLTKAEKLQIVNLAPTEAVELYVIVEELEDRLGDKMQDILTSVQASLNDQIASVEPIQPQADEIYQQQPQQLAFSADDVEGWADEQEYIHEDGNTEDAVGDVDDEEE